MVVRYVRDMNRNPIACLVLIGVDVGWSACNWKKGDCFNKRFALTQAIERANTQDNKNMPIFLKNTIEDFKSNPKHCSLLIDEFDVRRKRVKPSEIFTTNIIGTILKFIDTSEEEE